MLSENITEALGQVKRLREIIVGRRFFKGYSGVARIAVGTVALVAAAVMASPLVSRDLDSHLIGWAVVFTIGIAINYGALAWWFLFSKEANRDINNLVPAIEMMPAIVVGGILSLAFVLNGYFNMLFGMWMCCFGLAHTSYRISLPKSIYIVGMFYIFCGAALLLKPGVTFLNPWPMGVVFFLGELAGGYVLIRARQEVTS